jgi:hypothetical protein
LSAVVEMEWDLAFVPFRRVIWIPAACATASEARRIKRGFEVVGGRPSRAPGRLPLPYQ